MKKTLNDFFTIQLVMKVLLWFQLTIDRKYKDYVYRKMLVQEYLKK